MSTAKGRDGLDREAQTRTGRVPLRLPVLTSWGHTDLQKGLLDF